MNKESTPLLSEGSLSSAIYSKDGSNNSNGSFMRDSLRQLMESFSSTERHHALKVLRVGPAASMIKDAVLGYQDAPYEGSYDPYENPDAVIRNMISVVCGRLTAYNWVKKLLLGANWMLFILSFLEPPQWCRDSNLEIAQGNLNYSLHEYGDCKVILDARGTTADGEENQEYYPNWNVMWLSVSQSKYVELSCISIIIFYMILKIGDDGFNLRLFFYPGYKRQVHSLQTTLLVCLVLGIISDYTVLNPFFRMIILGSFLRNFQKEFLTMMKMIPEMAYILAILAIFTIFYAWFGVVLFYNSPQGANSFPNLLEGVWTLWICVTTANYPDVMMPSYNDNRLLSALYFISFMVISFFYLMNLILAVTLNSYDDSIVERRRSRKELSRNLLLEAYEMLDHDNRNSVSRESIMAVMLILNQDVLEIQRLSKDERGIIFAFLDKDGSSTISLNEFLDFGKILLLKLTKLSDYATFVEEKFPHVHQSNWFQGLCTFVRSIGFEYCIDIILVLNAVIIAFQDYPMLAGEAVTGDPHFDDGYIDTVWELMETVFTVLYVVEAMLKITVEGWKRYSESMRNMFDFFITLLAVLATAYVYYPNAYSDSRLIQFILMARVLRLGRLLVAIKAFQMFGTISVDIIPAASSVFMILVFILYFFASMGMFLYGGLITRDPANPLSYTLLEADDFVDNNYWANNFNDMFSGMNVLFNLLVVNNWTECEIGLEYVTGAKRVRFFFLAFHLLGVIVISNVVTSFIINAYFQQMETIVHRLGWEENMEGEAVLKGARGVFDATTVTGTKTGAHSVYIARIAPRHMDIEVDERAMLRNLFTRTSSDLIAK